MKYLAAVGRPQLGTDDLDLVADPQRRPFEVDETPLEHLTRAQMIDNTDRLVTTTNSLSGGTQFNLNFVASE